jgi:hypothetical protein
MAWPLLLQPAVDLFKVQAEDEAARITHVWSAVN